MTPDTTTPATTTKGSPQPGVTRAWSSVLRRPRAAARTSMPATKANTAVAAVRRGQEAERAARRRAAAGMAAGGVELGPRPDPGGPVETAELRADMQDELNADWFPATGRQAQGALVGTAAVAAAGIVVGGVIGLIAGLG